MLHIAMIGGCAVRGSLGRPACPPALADSFEQPIFTNLDRVRKPSAGLIHRTDRGS